MRTFLLWLGLVGAALAEDALPYQKLVGASFVDELDDMPVSVQVVYDGMADAQVVNFIYRRSKIHVKDKIFLAHHDPAGAPGQPMAPGGPVQPPFALSLPKASADAILALKPGTLITVTGTAHKAVFGIWPMKSQSIYLEGSSAVVPAPATP